MHMSEVVEKTEKKKFSLNPKLENVVKAIFTILFSTCLVCQYFQKGKPIIITGHLQTRQYEASDGSKRKVVEIVAGNVDFVIGDKTGGNTGAYEAPQPAAAYSAPSAPAQSMDSLIDTPTLDDGDLPF